MRPPIVFLLALVVPCHANDAALASFEKLVATCRSTYASPVPKVFFQPSKQKWVKRVEHPEDFKYDVRKTDSLVSPLTAYIEASTLGAAEFADTEELASAATPSLTGMVTRSTVRYSYAYRNGTWQFVNATETMVSRDSPSSSYRNPISFPRTKAALVKEALPWSACIDG